MPPSTIIGIELGEQEWRDYLLLRYVIETPELPSHYDRFGAAFKICRALDWNKGGLITARHNELRDGFADLARKASTPAHVRDDQKIFTGNAVREGKAKAKGKGAAKWKEAPPPEEG